MTATVLSNGRKLRGGVRAGVAISLIALAALAGCRAEEQGRITQFEKGVYLGEADEAIDKDTKRALHQRAQNQSF